jgi:hypothetical protein
VHVQSTTNISVDPAHFLLRDATDCPPAAAVPPPPAGGPCAACAGHADCADGWGVCDGGRCANLGRAGLVALLPDGGAAAVPVGSVVWTVRAGAMRNLSALLLVAGEEKAPFKARPPLPAAAAAAGPHPWLARSLLLQALILLCDHSRLVSFCGAG